MMQWGDLISRQTRGEGLQIAEFTVAQRRGGFKKKKGPLDAVILTVCGPIPPACVEAYTHLQKLY